MEIICLASSFLSYWTGLQKGSARKELEIGAEALKMAAINFHSQDTEDGTGLCAATVTTRVTVPVGR